MCAPPEDPMNFKRSSLVALAVSLIAVLPARADEWSKTYNLNGRPQLRIETSDANIRITTWDQNTIEAKVITEHYKIGEGGIRVEEHQNGDSVEIDVHYPHHNFNIEWGRHKVDIIVQMPHEGRVNLRTGDGKIDIAGLKGDMDLHTGDGSKTSNQSTANCTPQPATDTSTPKGASMSSSSRRAMATWTCARRAGHHWPPAGGSKPAMAAYLWQSPANWPPMWTCTPATATLISICRSPRKARFGRTKCAASSTVAAAL